MLGEAADVAAGVAGLTFREGDLTTFADADGVDVVLSNAALHWVDDHETVLARWRESLRDGGQVAVQMPINTDHPSHVLARALAEEEPFVSAFGGPVPVDPVTRVLPPERYSTLLDRLGFTEQHVRVQVYLHHMPSTADVVQWMKGANLTRFEESLPPELYAQYLDRYRERLLDALGDQRPFPYTYKRILFWARKS
jgi:trans-aconitate 2-methyltransferase